MAVFTQDSVGFSAQLDSKGRITIPVRIRNRLELEKGDRVSLNLESSSILRKKFSSREEALKFLSGVQNVESFSFDGETLEVVIDE